MIPKRPGPCNPEVLAFYFFRHRRRHYRHVCQLKTGNRSTHQFTDELAGTNLHQLRGSNNQPPLATRRADPEDPSRTPERTSIVNLAFVETFGRLLQRD